MDFTLAFVISICMGVLMVVAIVGMVLDHEKKKRQKGSELPPPSPLRTSVLAGFSFFSGVIAILLVTASSIMAACTSMNEITGIPESVKAPVDMAARIILYCSLLPAVGAGALALGARGSIKESRETLGGRSLYRTGLFLSILSAVLVLDAKVVNPASWGSAGGNGGAGGSGGILSLVRGKDTANHGYLGIDHEPVAGTNVVRVVRVHPGTPAEQAGLKADDVISEVDGVSLALGSSLADRIGALKPGTNVTLTVSRLDGKHHLTAVLAQPFSVLLEALEDESLDSSRLAVFRAAGTERRYTAAELQQICEAFSFDSSREEAAMLALPHLIDLQNAYQILPAFSFGSSKETLSRRIADLMKSKK
jgi:membrane-associated protease RseP (regulator of RpoE activity)